MSRLSDNTKRAARKKGFTLLEVIVATGLLFAAVVSVLVLISFSLRSIRDADNGLIASHLAQEAIEVVAAIRNTNWQNGVNWQTNILPPTAGSITGIVNYNSALVNETTSANFCINYDANMGIYTHGSGGSCNTPFERHLEISRETETLSGQQVEYLAVQSIVEWTGVSGNTKQVHISHRLYNWR